MPVDSPARALHLPLIAFLANSLNFPDADLPRGLTLGMGITGTVPATNTLRPIVRVPTVSHTEWEARIPTTNKEVVEGIMSKQGTHAANARWNLSLKEVARGWISEPVPLTP